MSVKVDWNLEPTESAGVGLVIERGRSCEDPSPALKGAVRGPPAPCLLARKACMHVHHSCLLHRTRCAKPCIRCVHASSRCVQRYKRRVTGYTRRLLGYAGVVLLCTGVSRVNKHDWWASKHSWWANRHGCWTGLPSRLPVFPDSSAVSLGFHWCILLWKTCQSPSMAGESRCPSFTSHKEVRYALP